MAGAEPAKSGGREPASMVPAFEHFPHDADIGLRGTGATLEEAFVEAAHALTATVTDLGLVGAETRIPIHCEAPDAETLFLDWLNAIIFEMVTRRMLFSRFEATISDGTLDGAAWGEAVDPERHSPAVEPKGATWTALEVAQDANGLWRAQCVVDV